MNTKINLINDENASLKTKMNLMNDENASLKTQINSLNNSHNTLKNENSTQINLLKTTINKLEGELGRVKDDQSLLWSYFSLIANGRDLFKSIPFYLYKYLKLSGSNDNYTKLTEIIKVLEGNLNEYPNELLLKYLRLENFLVRTFNFLLHRKLQIKAQASQTINFIPKYTFDDCFDNLIIFIESIIYKEDVQMAIHETIKDMNKDTSIHDSLKYKDGNIFKKNNSGYAPIMSKNEIYQVRDFLKAIKIDGKEFPKLCESKVWNNFEDVQKPIFYNSSKRFDDNN